MRCPPSFFSNNLMLEKKLNNAYRDTIYRLSAAAEYRDPETSHHLTRISHYCKIIAKHLGLPNDMQELLFDASPMHDIGKRGIPDAILLKPGKLTDEEREIQRFAGRRDADRRADYCLGRCI